MSPTLQQHCRCHGAGLFQILIKDWVLPDTGKPHVATLLDIQMIIVLSGTEITRTTALIEAVSKMQAQCSNAWIKKDLGCEACFVH